MKINQRAPKKKKAWPRYCFYAALGLLLVAGILYVIYCQSFNSEFARFEDYFGDSFDEIYSMPNIDGDIADTVVAQAKKAMNTIGADEKFGALKAYCIDPAEYPDAVKSKATIDTLTGKVSGNSGYLWVAYRRTVYDANGKVIAKIGSEDARILSRWRVEKVSGKWAVTEVREKP